MMVSRPVEERAELVKAEIVRRAIEADQPLMTMLEVSMAQVTLGARMIPVEEVKARYAGGRKVSTGD